MGNAEDRIQEDYLRILRYFRYGRLFAEFESSASSASLHIAFPIPICHVGMFQKQLVVRSSESTQWLVGTNSYFMIVCAWT